jgi:arylsulfatase A-like enzyme
MALSAALLLLPLPLLLLTGHAAGTIASARQPNVITILTDDQGFGDNGYYCENSTGLCALTPHMDYLATSPHSVIFHRFYSAAGVCSPTRAALLTGRTNQRDCIWSALTCDGENPAPTCSMGVDGSLPWTEFTTAKAARKAGLSTIHIGKCETMLTTNAVC